MRVDPTAVDPTAVDAAVDAADAAVVVEVRVGDGDVDDVSAAAWALGAWSIEERPSLDAATALVVGFPDPLVAAVAAAVLGGSVAPVADGWQDLWRAHARVRRAGRHLVLRPLWVPLGPVADDDLVVGLEPGRAFGDGGHPTTRAALAALEHVVAAGDRVLDVGCGCGVLSIAAVLLGAAAAHGIDLDPHAVAVTEVMAAANGVAHAVTAAVVPLVAVAGVHDVVVANLGGTAVLVALAADLDRLCGRTLVLGGMLDGREQPALDALAGWAPERRWVDDGWTTVALRRRTGRAASGAPT